ncbi:6-carboxytetrahydropterin synthase [Planomonospora sp. ID82291]|uniref:6-carboxytetrahydropterin synthase n=1 Tax=Planomonospora sp. ID82291 TaxID=2738136 RepID=UPI0018C3DC07|nr:6-carboxytetrahydropterin synthase [Planomonospora sp. ID82291]MBG0818272.1 6-carboxytetrahydropterin synthase [Planomonospora sp. ID82291]
MFTTVFTHCFNASHQLPYLRGERGGLHGHTWQAAFTVVAGSLDEHGRLLDEAAFAARMTTFIDARLANATLLGHRDPFAPIMDGHGKKLFLFGGDYDGAAWPTAGAVALLLAHHAHGWLTETADRADLHLASVTIAPSGANPTTWHNPAHALVPAPRPIPASALAA